MEAELEERLTSALAGREVRLIDVPVEARVNQELVEKLETHWSGR